MKDTAGLREQGFSMIEVLVTIVIVAIGLLGLSGLQAKTSVIEMESYQRAQAMALLSDLEDRIRASRSDFPAAGTTIRIGPNGTAGYNPPVDPTTCSGSGLSRQLCEWALLLSGAGETSGGARVGTMLGARACIISVTPSETAALAEIYLVVTWQGMIATTDLEGEAATCAGTRYGGGQARAAVTRVMLPKLDA